MKKRAFISSVILSATLLSSCTTANSKIRPKSTTDLSSILEKEENKNDPVSIYDIGNEYTHEMAEADADDQKIKQEVGVAEIDKELPGSVDDKVPFARNFLAQKNTKRMEFWVDYFTKKNHARFQRFINNGEEYRKIIEEVFASHGLPKELYFVGLIESGYYLGAKSHASAVGPWQFIRGTGKRYGLKITPEIDERQDLFKASKAAAMYFKDLHNVFSSWELALSAYNAGEYGIIRRIMKHGTRDFYELSRNKQLPSETINYVPKVLAAMHVVNNAQKYGFVIPKKKHKLFDLTRLAPVKKNLPLSVIAKRLNVSPYTLKKLNPELRGNSTPRYLSGTYYLRIPQSEYSYKSQEVAPEIEVAKLVKPESRKEQNRRTAFIEETISTKSNDTESFENRTQIHKVKRGETFFSIARKYELTPRQLAKLNGLRSWKTNVITGQRIRVAGEARQQKVISKTNRPSLKVTNRPIVYKIKRGDNLTDIAKLFDIKLSKIKKANNLKKGNVIIGQKIILPDTKKGIYIVKKGDRLLKVARELKQPLETIIKLNSLKQRDIYPGQKIIVNMD
jgi:membrane-bound lytic murein transglycosylase D